MRVDVGRIPVGPARTYRRIAIQKKFSLTHTHTYAERFVKLTRERNDKLRFFPFTPFLLFIMQGYERSLNASADVSSFTHFVAPISRLICESVRSKNVIASDRKGTRRPVSRGSTSEENGFTRQHAKSLR